MYLKSLDIHGFKSFADKTKLEFHQGVTGIVGPNGCGKSNVVDAIRWVLGETSAKALRGEGMADVIFNGTEKRKPLGMAEVTLTLANCEEALKVEYNEVAVTRRVFRDGKSEYRINGTLCRLKDVHDLFMDTGIGRTAYSIMAQGQIDQILSSKPEERRVVFEEAAGITKYKREKRDALRKLEYTEANLLRVGDVLAEQERRMNSLKRQVSKARRYQALARDVKILDTHLSHRKFVEMEAEAAELRVSIRSLEGEEGRLEAEMAPKEEAVAVARETARNFEGELGELRQKLNEHRHALSAAEGRIAFNKERRAELEERIRQNEGEIHDTRERLARQESDVVTASEAFEALVRRIADIEGQLAAQEERGAEARQRRVLAEAQLREQRKVANETQSSIAAMKAKLESSLTMLESGRERERQLAAQEQRLEQDVEEMTRCRDEIISELEAEAGRSEDLENACQTAERQYQHARGDLDAARKRLAESHARVTTCRSRLEALRQLAASGEGFEQGTRRVLAGLGDPKRYGAGIHGVLAGYVTVDDAHARAVEAALGEYLQAILVEDSQLAEELVAKLAQEKKGRARVLPQDFVRPSRGTQMEALPAGATAWALDKVKVDQRVGRVIEQLLANVLIVPDLASGMKLHREWPDVVMVTATGEWISAEGVIAGGTVGDASVSVLARQNEIRRLGDELAMLETAHAEAQEQVEQWEADQARLAEEREAARDRAQQHQIQLSTLEGQRTLAVREVEAASTKLENTRRERGELERREQAARDNCQSLELGLAGASQRLEAAEADLARLQTEWEGARHAEAELQEGVAELRMQVAVEQRAKQAHEAQQQPMQARLLELQELAVRREAEIENFRKRIGSSEAENAGLAEEIDRHGTQARELEENISGRLGQRQGLIDAIESAEHELNQVRQNQARAAGQRGKEEVALTKVELRVENLVNTIQERYNLELAGFEPDAHALLTCIASQRKPGRAPLVEADEEEEAPVHGDDGSEDSMPAALADGPDWEFVEICVNESRRRLDGMGPVNIDAIEEFEELEERHNDVRRNYEDLIHSKEELLQVIEKINEESQRRFSETFAQVRKNFRSMFKELFGEEGKADLQLVDEADPLESGIEVIAKPPGKKLQSISLLSGGERSMTAVALLFSIYMIKPSPFCVLDELDAPLDESNIGRFIRVLDHFVHNSQFIIVTHSKRTMSRSDIMYGVTMEEFGVSKLVGMRLTSADEGPDKGEAKTAAQKAALKLDA